MYTPLCLLLAVLLSIECNHAQQQHHKEMKVDHIKLSHQSPASKEPQALVPGPPPVSDLTVFIKNFSKPEMTAEEKEISAFNLTKEEKEKLFPCDDYSFLCQHYIYTKDQQCRDVFMQHNCRKTCELCDVPYGVFIGCADLKVCKKFAKSACMLRWVRETCKSKCGQCGGYERQASSSIFMAKKRHTVGTKLAHSTGEKQHNKQSKKGFKTVKSIEEKDMKVKVTLQKNNKQQDTEKTAKTLLQPKETAVEKAVPKNEESFADDKREGSGDQDKETTKNTEDRSRDEESNDDEKDNNVDKDGDNDDEVDSDYKNEDKETNDEGSSEDEDDNKEGSNEKPGVVVNTARHADKPFESVEPAEPVRMNVEPGGEPIVAKWLTQPSKFHHGQEPDKTSTKKIARHEKYRTIPNRKRVQSKKVVHDKVEKKSKPVKRSKKNDKAKTKTGVVKKHKN